MTLANLLSFVSVYPSGSSCLLMPCAPYMWLMKPFLCLREPSQEAELAAAEAQATQSLGLLADSWSWAGAGFSGLRQKSAGRRAKPGGGCFLWVPELRDQPLPSKAPLFQA